MPKQLSLLKDPRKNTKLWWIQKHHVYGGSINYRKAPRPFDSKKLTHAVFKAKLGPAIWFTRSQKSILELLDGAAVRYGIRIKDVAINKDHIHLVFYTKQRASQIRFLRFFAAEMGRKYKIIHRRFGISQSNPLWTARPFTRLVSWGKKSLVRLQAYLKKNRDEVMGFIEYQPRRHALSRFLSRWPITAPNRNKNQLKAQTPGRRLGKHHMDGNSIASQSEIKRIGGNCIASLAVFIRRLGGDIACITPVRAPGIANDPSADACREIAIGIEDAIAGTVDAGFTAVAFDRHHVVDVGDFFVRALVVNAGRVVLPVVIDGNVDRNRLVENTDGVGNILK
jgi:hypothetical protein